MVEIQYTVLLKNCIILVGGLPGSGKTTFAKSLATRISARHINSDEVRAAHHLLGDYSTATKNEVYRLMLQQVENWVSESHTVVIDATFYLAQHRQEFFTLANRYRLFLFFFLIIADEETIRDRVSRKRPLTEADFAVYQRVKKAFEPLDVPYCKLDSSHTDLEQMLNVASNYLNVMPNDGLPRT